MMYSLNIWIVIFQDMDIDSCLSASLVSSSLSGSNPSLNTLSGDYGMAARPISLPADNSFARAQGKDLVLKSIK